MKNIHILPTDKPSRLAGSEYIINEQGIDKRAFKLKSWNKLIPNKDLKDVGYTPLNLYITNDEEIKEGDWWYNIVNNEFGKSYFKNSIPAEWGETKKIILTTDLDLIADGVQAIDDEFLEWFIKNPSYELVETKLVDFEVDMGLGDECVEYSSYYEITIPQEEPKQQTLEEVVEQELENHFFSNISEIKKAKYFINFGIELQKEQDKNKFSEEEVIKIAKQYARRCQAPIQDSKWFEQFKKK
jgi:hypothetical protein